MLSDLDIGMNDWVVPRLTWDDSYRPDRGRVLSPEDLEKIAKFQRYTNEDENHVAARTLPGVDSKARFSRAAPATTNSAATPKSPDEYQEVMDRLLKKHKAAAKFVPDADHRTAAKAPRSASSPWAAAIRRCARPWTFWPSAACSADFMRVRGFPFDDSVEAFLERHEFCFVVEQNRDAQLRSLLTLETSVPKTSCAPCWCTADSRSAPSTSSMEFCKSSSPESPEL